MNKSMRCLMLLLAHQINLGLTLALLDTKIDHLSSRMGDCQSRIFHTENQCNFAYNVMHDQPYEFFDPVSLDNQKTFNTRRNFSPFFFRNNKSHGTRLKEKILQHISEIDIISIPILNRYGVCSKQTLLHALAHLQDYHVDVLLLSLRIKDFNIIQNQIDFEIAKILKNFPFVIIASGNDGQIKGPKPFYAYSFFSIAACDDAENILNFSTFHLKYKPHFASVGLEGTSFAAAEFAACILLLLEQGYDKKQIIKIVKKISRKKKMNKDKKIKFGIVHPFEIVNFNNSLCD